MFVLPTIRVLLMALAVATGFGIFLQLNAFRSETKSPSSETKPPSSVVRAETGFSYINDLQKDTGQLPEQIRYASPTPLKSGSESLLRGRYQLTQLLERCCGVVSRR